jgi:photosystem II stability/assembly factor-like uncharacterized protein
MQYSNEINFSLSNVNIDFSKKNIKKTYLIDLAGTWWKIAVSATGQYQTAIQRSLNGRIFISNDYGKTWNPASIELYGNLTGVSVSNDGKYQTVLQQNGGITISSDYGKTWVVIDLCVIRSPTGELIIFSTDRNWYATNLSASGQYQTSVSFIDNAYEGGYIFTSNNYGTSWIDSTPKNRIVPGYYYGVSLSYTGKIQLVAITANSSPDGISYLSSYILSYDYGLTWSDSVILGKNLVNCVMNKSPDQDIDGRYQYLIDSGGDGIFRSIDFGKTWELVYANNSNWRNICISSSGKYVYAATQSNFIGISKDYGNTWYNKYFDVSITCISTSEDGSIISVPSLKNKIFISYDYGETFNIDNDSPEYVSINDIAMSSNGQIQTVSVTNGKILQSYNYGNNWIGTTEIKNWSQNAMSLTGQYQTVYEIGNGVYTSSNYGQLWIPGDNLGLQIVSNINMSGDAKYQIIVNGNVIDGLTPCIYLSYNYGLNWVPKIIPTIRRLCDSAMSINGQYILITDNLGEDFASSWTYLSDDYGLSFKSFRYSSSSTNIIYVSMSSTGRDMLSAYYVDEFVLKITNDYGKTWKTYTVSELDNLENYKLYIPIKCRVSSTGEFQYVTMQKGTNNVIIYSKNYGYNWEVFNIGSLKNNVTALSSNGQYIGFSNQNSIYELYLDTLQK